MKRRTFISGFITTPFAGCIGSSAEESSGTTNTIPEKTNPMQTTVAVKTADNVSDIPLRFSVEMLESEASTEHPPRLRIAVRNTGHESITVLSSPTFPFSSLESENTEPGLMILPLTSDDRAHIEDCWQLDRPETEPLPTRGRMDGERIKPGQSVSGTYEVWSHYTNETCFPTGDYRFEQTYSLSNKGLNFTWGFTLHVER